MDGARRANKKLCYCLFYKVVNDALLAVIIKSKNRSIFIG